MRDHAPHDLRVDGTQEPIGVDAEGPLLSWRRGGARSRSRVLLLDAAGGAVWDSGELHLPVPEVRVPREVLSSRTRYTWTVRDLPEGDESPGVERGTWSSSSHFETALLEPQDWEAVWIARAVPPAQRIVRALPEDRVVGVEPGHQLGQTFTAAGELRSVSLDLTCDLGEPVVARLRVLRPDGTPVASSDITGGVFPWDRFSTLVEVDPPAPPGPYEVELTPVRGAIGWRSGSTPPPEDPDDLGDGVGPVPVRGAATVDGRAVDGVRAVGIECDVAPNPVFTVDFDVPAGAHGARLHATGLGYGVFGVNGTPVDTAPLEPAQTAYDTTVLYRSHDVTGLLRVGRNTLEAELGRGFYAARGASVWGWHLAPWSAEPRLIAQLEYLDPDGTRHVVGSGPSWRCSDGPTRAEGLYTGEVHDPAAAARGGWVPAAIVPAPGGSLRTAVQPPVRPGGPVSPVSTSPRGPNAVVVDFGQVITGRLAVTLEGETGGPVSVTYGEYLSEDGDVVCDNVLATGRAQTDVVVLPSGGPVTWSGRAGYKGFRYVALTSPRPFAVRDLVAVPLVAEVTRVGEFDCDEPTLRWIDAATSRTFLNNLHGVPTDTPVYEKNGWTADAHLVTEAVLHHYDLRTTLGKWLQDHADAQADDGSVPQIVPSPGWGARLDPAWSSSTVLIAWNLYWEHGDLGLLERSAGPVARYADAVVEALDDGVWRHHSWGDWLAPGHQFAPEGGGPAATAMAHLVFSTAAQIFGALGDERRVAENTQRAAVVAAGYHREHFDALEGSYRMPGVAYRQAMNVLPLAFGMVPEAHVPSVSRSLVDDVERRGGHLDVGAIAVKHLPAVLAAAGREDLAVTVLTTPESPGWGAWRAAGSQTLFEAWDDSARSRNHYFLGSVAWWIQQRVGAVRSTSPGWGSFEVRPVDDPRVRRGSSRHATARGDVAVDWDRDGDRWRVSVDVPPGTSATVLLPGAPPAGASSGHHVVTWDAAVEDLLVDGASSTT